MSDNKVLVAYGTRYGATEEISQKIANTLEHRGISPDLLNLGETKSKNWPSISNYKGIIVGSGIKATMWTKGVKSFLNKNKENLQKNDSKFGMFSVGLDAAVYLKEARELIAEKLKEKHELEADIHIAFGGVIDLSENSKHGKAIKSLIKSIAKKMQEDSGLEIEMEGCNDYRDWENIVKFAESFADML
jgi:menaquinone-dependent protoporphyrinogen oxidase